MRVIRGKPTKKEYVRLLEKVRELEDEKEQLRNLVDNYRNILARMQIDFNNFRKRVERDRELERAMASERII
ncbi:MAG: hypothetical protein J7M13_02095, partial [Synergistetes bacterium]|nr:hypothetical protein [Synergistota bacterium]